MKENPEFIGRKYTEHEKRGAAESLRRWSKEASKPVEGECEKTEEEIKIIDTANFLIRFELHWLGIEEYQPMPPERIHLLREGVYKRRFPASSSRAFFRATEDAIYVNEDGEPTKAHLLATLVHELMHRASTIKFYADHEGGISEARVGYRVRSPWKKSERENRLAGFSELMNDMTVYLILLKNQDLLEKNLGITKEDIQGSIYAYMNYAPIIEAIVAKVSAEKNMPLSEAFKNFERGQFSSSILVLKDVERFFGKGSLNVLSLLGTGGRKKGDERLEEMIKNFFTEKDESKRQALRIEIEELASKSAQIDQTES